MPNCADLRRQRDSLQKELGEVTAQLAATTDPDERQLLRLRQAELREQLSTVETLINQNCGAVESVKPGPALRVLTKEHEKAVKELTKASLNLSKATRKRKP